MTLDTLVFVFPQNMTRDVTVSQITSDQGGSLLRLELQPCFSSGGLLGRQTDQGKTPARQVDG
jgi:hypothetical protein